jgi:hypothetical protein
MEGLTCYLPEVYFGFAWGLLEIYLRGPYGLWRGLLAIYLRFAGDLLEVWLIFTCAGRRGYGRAYLRVT